MSKPESEPFLGRVAIQSLLGIGLRRCSRQFCVPCADIEMGIDKPLSYNALASCGDESYLAMAS